MAGGGVAHIAPGGADGKALYLTALTSGYRVRVQTEGILPGPVLTASKSDTRVDSSFWRRAANDLCAVTRDRSSGRGERSGACEGARLCRSAERSIQ